MRDSGAVLEMKNRRQFLLFLILVLVGALLFGSVPASAGENPGRGKSLAEARKALEQELLLAAEAGFVGIAVALMGRSHPVGIVPAAILFGMLYQGGAEISFEMPQISRDMITIIQGLVILFAGALENMFRPAITAFFATLGGARSDKSIAAAE